MSNIERSTFLFYVRSTVRLRSGKGQKEYQEYAESHFDYISYNVAILLKELKCNCKQVPQYCQLYK